MANNGHYTPLIRIEPVSLCKYLNGKKKHPVFKFIFKLIQQYGKIPTSCPIKKVIIIDFPRPSSLIEIFFRVTTTSTTLKLMMASSQQWLHPVIIVSICKLPSLTTTTCKRSFTKQFLISPLNKKVKRSPAKVLKNKRAESLDSTLKTLVLVSVIFKICHINSLVEVYF